MTLKAQHHFSFHENGNELRLAQRAHHILLIAAHEPSDDPRLQWVESASPEQVSIQQLGVRHPSHPYGYLRPTARNNMVRASRRMQWSPSMLDAWQKAAGDQPCGQAALKDIEGIREMLSLSRSALSEKMGIPPADDRIEHFRWYMQYLLDTTATIMYEASTMKGAGGIIATDLDTMPAALLIKAVKNIPVFYDAHEYWPEADVNSSPWEISYWEGLENRLVQYADYCQTVSPGLAQLMSKQYDKAFHYVPNCELPNHALAERHQKTSGDTCSFLFLGGFAPDRGIDLLIQLWPRTNEKAILLLQGPDNLYKEEMRRLAQASGLYGKRIFFPNAVEEHELIHTASMADVGLIPYTPTGKNYRYCSPNKLSQYMAAWVPIIANSTEFVASVVTDAQCGYVRDFTDSETLIETIDQLTNDPSLREQYGRNGHEYFVSRYNWREVSKDFYAAIQEKAVETDEFVFLLNRSSVVQTTAPEASLNAPEIHEENPNESTEAPTEIETPPIPQEIFVQIDEPINTAHSDKVLHTFGACVRPFVRCAYRHVMQNSNGLVYRTVKPFYRLIPARWRYFLVHQAD